MELDLLALLLTIGGNLLIHLIHGFEWIVGIYKYVFRSFPEQIDLEDF